MKRTGLVVLIVICLIVFTAFMTSGILLTVRSIGWQELLDQSSLHDTLQRMMERSAFIPWPPAGRTAFTYDESKPFDLAGIRLIEISTVSENITVGTTKSTGTARLSGTYSAAAPMRFIVEVQGDTLKVRIEYPRFGILLNNLKLAVSVPENYEGALMIRSVSGAVTLPGDAAAGRERLEIGTVSGRIGVERADYADISATSVSGEIVLRGITGTLSCKSTSGAVRLDYETFQASTVRTVSGSVEITLPQQADAAVSFATVSGGFSNQGLPLTVETQTSRKFTGSMGDGSQKLDISTTSGALRLKSR